MSDISNIESKLSICDDCKYIGTAGKWYGNVYFEDGTKQEVHGLVPLLEDDTYDLSPLFEECGLDVNFIESFDGEACCPICDSANFY